MRTISKLLTVVYTFGLAALLRRGSALDPVEHFRRAGVL